MSIKEIVYSGFYVVGFILGIWSGVDTGFKGNSHTGPIPFYIELFILFIGLFLLMIDLFISGRLILKRIRVHIWGPFANGAVIGYCVVLV